MDETEDKPAGPAFTETNGRSAPETVDEPPAARHTALLWAILLIILIAYVSAYLSGGRNRSESVFLPRRGCSIQFQLMGRYAVGLKALLRDRGPSNHVKGILTQLERSGSDPSDRACMAVFLAEVSGKRKALEYIDGLVQEGGQSQWMRDDLKALRRVLELGPASLDETDRRRILDRYGWVAELAMTVELPSEDPRRERVLSSATRLVRATVILLGGFGMLLIISVGLFLLGWLLASKGKLTPLYPKEHKISIQRPVVFFETTVLFLSLLSLARFLSPHIPQAFFWMLYFLSLLSIFWGLLRGLGWSCVATGLGWRAGRGVLRELGCGIVGYLAGLPIVMVGLALTLLLMKLTGRQPVHPIVFEFQGAGFTKLLWLLAMASVIAPVIEETVFRGAFYHYLRFQLPAILSALLTGVVFAAIHPQGLEAFPALCALGAVFALLREWRGSLLASMTAHATNNFLVIGILILYLSC